MSALSAHSAWVHQYDRQHLVDSAYVSADELVASQTAFNVDLLGPIHGNGWWQAKADQGYDLDSLCIDWQAETATCPQGKTSIRWNPPPTPYGQETISVAFAFEDCTPCPVRSLCAASHSDAAQSDASTGAPAPGHPHRA